MRLIPTILLAYIVLGIQSGLSPFIAIDGMSPNLTLAVAIFVSLYAQKETALMGVFLLGLMQDMLTQAPLGVHPFVYAFVAIATRLTQPAIQREHWLTHIVVVCIGCALHAAILFVVGFRIPPRHSWQSLGNMAIYTAVVALVLLRVLVWSRRVFVAPVTAKSAGFPPGKG